MFGGTDTYRDAGALYLLMQV